MDKLLYILCVIMGFAMVSLASAQGASSVLLVLFLSIPTILLIHYYSEDKMFITNVFLIALLVRLTLGLVIHVFELRSLFGPDAISYDVVGERLTDVWLGVPVPDDYITYRATRETIGLSWGINYLIASIYYIWGKGILISQSFCAFVGAATAPMIYFCAEKNFHNQRVARISAVAIAVFPSFIVWSSQLLKDGLIIFLLVFTMTMVLQLQKKFSYVTVTLLISALFGILSLRFYIFYMMAAAVAGSFIIGLSTSFKSILRRTALIVITGVALTYLGVLRTATTDFEQFGNLDRVQLSRQDLAQAKSGFGADIDVSTLGGVLAAIPIGFSYLILAPFPWQMEDAKTLLLLPEMLVWWASIPLMIIGLLYIAKNRFRPAIPILIFTLMLTISYSVFQANVGMAYRQRTQLQVFFFIFIAVGWTMLQESRENERIVQQAEQQKFRLMLKANRLEM